MALLLKALSNHRSFDATIWMHATDIIFTVYLAILALLWFKSVTTIVQQYRVHVIFLSAFYSAHRAAYLLFYPQDPSVCQVYLVWIVFVLSTVVLVLAITADSGPELQSDYGLNQRKVSPLSTKTAEIIGNVSRTACALYIPRLRRCLKAFQPISAVILGRSRLCSHKSGTFLDQAKFHH